MAEKLNTVFLYNTSKNTVMRDVSVKYTQQNAISILQEENDESSLAKSTQSPSSKSRMSRESEPTSLAQMSGSKDAITVFVNGKEAKFGNKVDPRMTLLQVRIIINY
jgi:hypothetical protein